MDEEILIRELREFQGMVHATARAKGFYRVPLSFAAKVALAHSELSEALEADRTAFDNPEHKKVLVAKELADCIIRILDMAEAHQLPVVRAMVEKAEFNKTRPMLHGRLY